MIYESEYGTVDFWDPYPRLNEFTYQAELILHLLHLWYAEN
jgi:hypothetical protein